MNNLPDRILILCDALDVALTEPKPKPVGLSPRAKELLRQAIEYLDRKVKAKVEVEELEELYER